MYVSDWATPNNIRSCPLTNLGMGACVDSGATGIGTLGASGMAIYTPSSKLFMTDAIGSKVFACTQTNGLLSGCVDTGATGLTNPRDIVFFGATALIADTDGKKLIACAVSGPTSLSGCVDTGVPGLAGGMGLLFVN